MQADDAAEGEAGAAAAPDAQPLALTLKAQVQMASGAEVADLLPSALYPKWLAFATATPPQLLFIPGKGVFLAPLKKDATQAENYAFYFEAEYELDKAGVRQFKLRCRAGGCGVVSSYAVRTFAEDSIKLHLPLCQCL